MFELATIAVNKVPLKILVMRNQYLGLVREHQEKVYQSHYSGVELHAYPHYEDLARAYDMACFHASSNEELDGELDRFLSSKEAAIMVCDIDSANNTK
jgi:acetolactate synthase-1/2/3 large subunit